MWIRSSSSSKVIDRIQTDTHTTISLPGPLERTVTTIIMPMSPKTVIVPVRPWSCCEKELSLYQSINYKQSIQTCLQYVAPRIAKDASGAQLRDNNHTVSHNWRRIKLKFHGSSFIVASSLTRFTRPTSSRVHALTWLVGRRLLRCSDARLFVCCVGLQIPRARLVTHTSLAST